jgi:predicted dithiol-disulfide oxidoreductase (DUF899 family)
MLNKPIVPHAVVARDEWLAARRALLAREKEATRRRNEGTIIDFVRRHDEYDAAKPQARGAAAKC